MRKSMGLPVLAMLLAAGAWADPPEIPLVIKDHRFEPATVKVPADTKVLLVVENRDATPEEFESHDLHREKVIAGGKTAKIALGPLKPGTYKFVGEFHEATAQGAVVVE